MSRRRTAICLSSIGAAVLVAAVAVPWPEARSAVGLAEYLGWRDGRTPGLALREAKAVQRRIAECMARLGMSYREHVEVPPAVPDADLGPRDWAAKWGFGVSTSFGTPRALPPVADPNLAYIDSLPAGERDGYRTTLFGSRTNRGCNDEANDAVYGRHDRLLAPLATELADVERRIAADPRTIAADRRWRACLSTEVFRPSGRRAFGREAIEFVAARLEAIMGPPPGRPDADPDALVALQRLEIDLAVRGVDCDDVVRPIDEAVRLVYEASFIEAHRVALDEIKARAVELDEPLGLGAGD